MKFSPRRPARPQRRRVAGWALIALAGPALGACSAMSPTPIVSPYPASDGTAADIADPATGVEVHLRNVLVVSSGKGKPGVVLGVVSTEGTTSPLSLQVQVLDSLGVSGAAPGFSLPIDPSRPTTLGPGGRWVQLAKVDEPPGATVKMVLNTPVGGTQFTVPVLAAQGPYASITPSPVASPSPSASPRPSGSASARGGAESPAPSASASESPTSSPKS